MVGDGVSKISFDAVHTSLADVIPIAISDYYPHIICSQRLSNHSANPSATNNQVSRGSRITNTEKTCERFCREALEHDGTNDHKES